MDPAIRFSRTSNGVNIASWAIGEGPTLVAMPSLPWSHIQMEWSIPAMRSWYELIAQGRRLVRYDGRGFGLSSRDPVEISLETDVDDLIAVVDRLEVDRFDLFAGLHSGPAAITYAARFPDRVDHLILFCSYADGGAHLGNPLTQATRPIIAQDWPFYCQLVSRLLLGWSETNAAQAFSDLVSECTSPEVAALALSATTSFDVSPVLADVGRPTLVLHRPEQRVSSMDNARALAAGIPNVQLSLQSGSSVAPFLGDTAAIAEQIDAFLTDRIPAAPRLATAASGATATSGGVSTVVFTDVVASTEMVERLGDDAARNALRSLEDVVAASAIDRTGRVVKHLGDGSLLEFASTKGALESAAEIQSRVADLGVEVAIGIAVGEPIREDGDLHGSIVVLASRITGAAGAGEVLVADAVRQLARGKGFEFDDAGPHVLKGFDEPVQLWRLRS